MFSKKIKKAKKKEAYLLRIVPNGFKKRTNFGIPSQITMEYEFALSDRLREKSLKEESEKLKAAAERERKGRALATEAERKRAEQAEKQRGMNARKLEREEEEESVTEGVKYMQWLAPVPFASLETDKVRLPQSALEKLIREGASMGNGRVLTFELALFDEKNEVVEAKTHAGVAEFTAEEGTVVLPIKTALSLGPKLSEYTKIRVRYRAIERFPKLKVKIQPVGKGFHENTEVANVDLKTALERVLSQQTTITQGDIVPIRYQGHTYELKVKELWPDTQAVLIDTEIEVDLLVSEYVENEQNVKKAIDVSAQVRRDRALKFSSLLSVEPSQAGEPFVAIRGRFPNSIVGQRKFPRLAKLSMLFAWGESLLGELEQPALVQMNTPPGANLEIVLVTGLGQNSTFTSEQAEKTLDELKFGRVENLNFKWRESLGKDVEMVDAVSPIVVGLAGEAWEATKKSAESRFDQVQDVVNGDGDSPSISKTDLFKLLVAGGAEPVSAAQSVQKYQSVLLTLHSMQLLQGEGKFGKRAVELLEKYKGSTGRVADDMLKDFNEAESVAPIAEEEVSVPRYTAEFQQLQLMFENRPESDLYEALKKHRGNVERAVHELLSS